MDTALFSTAWFAPVEYYIYFRQYKKRFIEGNENYVKQTYRNRCMIYSANGPMMLSLPIEKNCNAKTPIKDIKVASTRNWQHMHWNSIASAYNSSPYFEYYADDIHPFFEKKEHFLFDYSESIREKICELIPMDSSAEITSEYFREEDVPNNIADFRRIIQPGEDLSSKKIFKPYYQVFERKLGFIPNLSILDLLFNMGPETILYL